MKRTLRLAIAAAVAAALAAPAASCARAQTTAQAVVDSAGIDRLVRAQVDSGFHGVVLVALGDSVIMRQQYGTGVRARNAFWIGSITKSFTAAAILLLQQEGKLSVRDSLAHFFPGAPRDKRGITLHQLLTHTAGLPANAAGSGIADRDSAVRAILAQPLLWKPGAGYRYGDDDYELLAAIVEVASGQSWEDVVERRILRPAILIETAYWCRRRAGAPPPIQSSTGARTPCPGTGDWGHRGANGMSSTAADLFRWSRALSAGGPLAEVGRELATPRVLVRREPPDTVHYGYGTRIYVRDGRTTEVMHSGASDDGHTAVVRVLPSGVTIVVLSNAGMHGNTTWASYVAQRLASRR